MQYADWWKRPILDSIYMYREQLQKLKHKYPSQLKNETSQLRLERLEKRLTQLEQELQKSFLMNPYVLYQFQLSLTRFQQKFTKWYDQLQRQPIAQIQQNEDTSAEGNAEDQAETLSAVPIGQHRLPPLPYSYDALEPYIDEKTMHLHHDIHHKKYVEDLNIAEREMQKARQTGNFSLIKHWEREAAFNGAGHYLHTIFWYVMSPKGGGKPRGELYEQIKHDFGTFSQFKKHFSSAAEKVEGGGWAILVWSPRAHRLEILQAEKHQNLSQWDVIPLLALDVWEHAYYLKYNNNRKKYIENWWNIVRWKEVEKRYHTAKHVLWKPF